jgi:hypothetical protein
LITFKDMELSRNVPGGKLGDCGFVEVLKRLLLWDPVNLRVTNSEEATALPHYPYLAGLVSLVAVWNARAVGCTESKNGQ